MPIVYVHGVATRDRQHPFAEIEAHLRRFIAPLLSASPQDVPVLQAFWGDLGAQFAYGGASRPQSLLLRQGAGGSGTDELQRALLLGGLGPALARGGVGAAPPAPASGLTSGRGGAAATAATGPRRLKDLDPDALSDLLVDLLARHESDPARRAEAALAADALAHDPLLPAQLAAAASLADEAALLASRLRVPRAGGLLAQGAGPAWLGHLGDDIGELFGRAASLPGAAASVVLGEVRVFLNSFVGLFLGDVFTYLHHRSDASGQGPGPIQQQFLDRLVEAQELQRQRGGEAIVVLSHSMGGQIVYDALTHFVPRDPRLAGLRIKLWCATASQVGFFEELRLFANSPPHDAAALAPKRPFPGAHLQAWYNVWDPNDFLSYTVDGIVEGVDDASYFSGMSLLGAHSGYLQRPSFYRQFAEQLRRALAQRP